MAFQGMIAEANQIPSIRWICLPALPHANAVDRWPSYIVSDGLTKKRHLFITVTLS